MGCFPVSGSDHDSMIPSVLQTEQNSQNVPNRPANGGGGNEWGEQTTGGWWGHNYTFHGLEERERGKQPATSANRETLAMRWGGEGGVFVSGGG